MPIQIGKKQTAQDSGDTLIECHGRIRNFCAIAVKLAASAGAPAQEVIAAANDLYRYFTISLPRHSADEDVSIAPRLRAAGPPPDVIDALDRMTAEHHQMDAVLARLIPLWGELKTSPEKLAVHAAALAPDSAELQKMFDVHLELEERVIIPAMRAKLSKQAEQEIMAEWRARRDLGDGKN